MNALLVNLILLRYILLFQNGIVYETISLRNNKFVRVSADTKIPLDIENREDISSSKYGFPRFISSSEILNDYVTVGLNELEIVVNLKNDSPTDYIIHKIYLEVIDRHKQNEVFENTGNWDIPIPNQYLESISFEIDSKVEHVVHFAEDLVIRKKGEDADRRVRLKVSCLSDDSESAEIVQFAIHIEASKLGEHNTEMRISSDKHYFIAVK